MAGGYDASGIYSRWFSWQDDAANGVKIVADRHDTEDNGFANALSLAILKDGRSSITNDIPWNGKKITNLADPVSPQDAATKDYVDTVPGWSTSKNITGADANGRLNFTNVSGVNGITFTNADLAWVAKVAKASETSNRLVLNDKVDATGTDRFIIDEVGRINNNGNLSNNLSYDGATWRTISPGIGTVLSYVNGVFSLLSNDTATITNPYVSTTPRIYFQAQNSAGSSLLTLTKSASGKQSRIYGNLGATNRWIMDLGNATAETATDRVGSDFTLYSSNNAGGAAFPELSISRQTHLATFGGNVAVSGDVAVSGRGTAANGFMNTDSTHGFYSSGAIRYFQFLTGYGFSCDTTNGDIRVLKDGGPWTYWRASDNALWHQFSLTYKPGGGPWSDSSDARIKNVLGDYTNGLAAINSLRPVHYSFIGNDTDEPPKAADPDAGKYVLPIPVVPVPENPEEMLSADRMAGVEPSVPYGNSPHYNSVKAGEQFIGLIAQEAEVMMPEIITKRTGYIDGVQITDLRDLNTGPLLFALINAVKELSAKITALEAKP